MLTHLFALFKLLDATLQTICTAVNQSEVGIGNLLHTNTPSAALEGQTNLSTKKVPGIGTIYQGFTQTT